jgi:hypothetical protein
MGIHYERNFNKREARYAKRFGRGFFIRRRLTNAEAERWPNASRTVNHWFLADESVRGQSGLAIVKSFRSFCERQNAPRQLAAGPNIAGYLPASTAEMQDRT